MLQDVFMHNDRKLVRYFNSDATDWKLTNVAFYIKWTEMSQDKFSIQYRAIIIASVYIYSVFQVILLAVHPVESEYIFFNVQKMFKEECKRNSNC